MSQPPSFPTFTKTWHSKPYDSISVTRPEISARGKNVVITGGGTGIGASIALAFAKAGVTGIGIIGRRETKLVETAKNIEALKQNTKVKYVTADVTNAAQIQAAFEQFKSAFGDIDILVANAGYLNTPASAVSVDPNDW
jgi:NAD(P)-dependent dehydrogenase (short-subunit alcohol dehydrogenase family)